MRMKVPPRRTATYVEQMTAQRREEERSLNELTKFNQENSMLTHAAQNEQRLAFQRQANAQAEIAAEEAMTEMRREREAEERRSERMTRQNESLAEALRMRSSAQTRQEIEVQRICAESEELKALEQRLRVAYINKDRAAQNEETRLLQQMERDREQAIADKMEHDRQRALKAEAEKQQARRKKVTQAQRDALHHQMREREKLKEEAQLEAEKDRRMVEGVVARIEEEERAEQESYIRAREETRRMAQDAERERARELEWRTRQEKEEKEDIRRYMQMVADREASLEEEKIRKKAAADLAFKRVVEQTEQQRNEEDELRMLRDMLWEEELEAKRIQDDEDRKRKVAENKVAMMEANDQQLRQRGQKREEDRKEEQRLIQIMLDKFQADEAREREEEQIREQMKMRHKRNIEEQKEERAALYEKEKASELLEAQAEREREAYRLRVVEEARKRLLEQHGAAVEGYLPKGALKTADELRFIRDLSRQKTDSGLGGGSDGAGPASGTNSLALGSPVP